MRVCRFRSRNVLHGRVGLHALDASVLALEEDEIDVGRLRRLGSFLDILRLLSNQCLGLGCDWLLLAFELGMSFCRCGRSSPQSR